MMSSLAAVLRIHRYFYNVIKNPQFNPHTHTQKFNCLVSQSCDNQSNLVKQSQWNQDTPHPSSASHQMNHCLDPSGAYEALVNGHMMPIKTVFVKLSLTQFTMLILCFVVFRLHIVASKAQEHRTRDGSQVLNLPRDTVRDAMVAVDLTPWLCIHSIMKHLHNHTALSNQSYDSIK